MYKKERKAISKKGQEARETMERAEKGGGEGGWGLKKGKCKCIKDGNQPLGGSRWKDRSE